MESRKPDAASHHPAAGSQATPGTAQEPVEAPSHRLDRDDRPSATLQAFVLKTFSTFGAEVEAVTDDQVTVVLPPSLYESFWNKDRLSLSFGRTLPDNQIELIRPNSRVLDRLLELLTGLGDGLVVERPERFTESPKPASLLKLHGCKRVSATRKVTSVVDLEAVFAVSYLSDEREEDLLIVSMPHFGEPSLLEDTQLGEDATPLDSSKLTISQAKLKTALFRAQSYAARKVDSRAAWREVSLMRRLEQEINRLVRYYGARIEETVNPVSRDQLHAELMGKIEQEIAAHGLSLEFSLLQWCALLRPVMRYYYRLERNQTTISVEMFHDRWEDTLVGHTCESCDKQADTLAICESPDEPHAGCPECILSCEMCDTMLCRAHGLSVCEETGRLLCTSHTHRCYRCRKVLASDLSLSCSQDLCVHLGCSSCVYTCADCGLVVCSEHSTTCHVCRKPVCATCARAPLSCGHYACRDHTRTTDKELLICSRCRIDGLA